MLITVLTVVFAVASVVAIGTAIILDRKLGRRMILESRAKKEERYALEQENQQMRIQLGMPPERRVALEDPPVSRSESPAKKPGSKAPRSGYRFAQARTTGSFGGSPLPLLLMAGAAAVLLSSKKKKRAGQRPVTPRRDLKALKERLERKNELVALGRGISDKLREGDLDELLEELEREVDADGQSEKDIH